ncbi:hypothetical protein ACIP8U_00430 [Streptomyces pseudovenezuelae]|uniref:hypothetical protein n=1 Tax=Streptomyces pseudovenezuelae TaxID=67350 RepID=UPI0038254F6A
MTTAKPKADAAEATVEPASDEEPKAEVPRCGAPHFLPALAHITCQRDAPDPDLPPGSPEHEHRHQDGDAIYVW